MRSLLLTGLLFCFQNVNAQWDRQYPFSHLGIVNDIVINGSVGVAVGDDATIFLTEDEGDTWTIHNNDLIAWNFSTAQRDKDLIYACGRGIYKSEDGGETFAVLSNAPQEIFDSYLSESGNLLVSNNGGVFKSLDQGETFISINTPVDSLGATSFILDENHIWWATAGSDPVMYITEDGGENWVANTGLTRPLKISFYNEQIGIAQSLPYWYRTEDGGHTWEERARLSRHVGKVIFGAGPDTVYISSAKNFYTSYDGCSSFNEHNNIISSSEINGLYKYESGKLLVGASFSTVAESIDEGASWADVTGQIKPSITAMISTDGQNVFAIGFGAILNTEDGGNNWSIFDTLNTAIRDVEVLENEALILSGTQKLIKKDLNSKAETTIYGPVPGIFESFHIMPSGKWLSYNSQDYYLISADQGVTWDSIYIEEFSNGIDMMENGDLFLRIRGKLLFSNNEGSSWDEIYTAELARDLNAISIVDSTIYVMESLHSLRKSRDYGMTWDSLATPTGYPMIVREMHFVTPDTGYVYDSAIDKLWYTYDGGVTWPFAYFPKSPLNGIYEFSNQDVRAIWLYGRGGLIEKQSACINAPLLSEIEGMRFPCILDTISYSVAGSNIDNFVWTIPDEWELVGSDSGSEIRIYAKEPGAGYLTVYGENSCGNTDALELQIAGTAIPVVEIINDGTSLTTNADGEQFQWFKDGVIIPEAIASFYVPMEIGEYTVLVTFSTGCSGLSNVVNFGVSAIHDVENTALIIYPNPIVEDYFKIEHSYDEVISDVEVFNILGRKVNDIKVEPYLRHTMINLPISISSGMYFVHLPEVNYTLSIYIK